MPKRLPDACPDCNGCVNRESMLCEDCGLKMLPRLTVPEVYELLYPERTRIEDQRLTVPLLLGRMGVAVAHHSISSVRCSFLKRTRIVAV